MKDIFTAVIVAAGTGKRMNSPVKKQYMEIASYPVLYHTIKAFEESAADGIFIVTGTDETEYVEKDIVEKYSFKKVIKVCAGGRERYDSVYEGLKAVAGTRSYGYEGRHFVLIHDGVRPLVTTGLINSCIEKVRESGACIPGVPEKDTVKEAGPDMEVAVTLDRKKLYRIQTPQCFELGLILKAFTKYYDERAAKAEIPDITDDAMLVEKYTGHRVRIIEGDYDNIKITTSEDIGLAEYLLNRRRS